MPSWPAGVTTYINESGYGEQPELNVRSFPTDIGPPLRSRASSVPGDIIEGTITCGSEDEYEDLAAFYTDDLRDGVLPFTRPHPRTQAADCMFVFESFRLTGVAGDAHHVTVRMRYLK